MSSIEVGGVVLDQLDIIVLSVVAAAVLAYVIYRATSKPAKKRGQGTTQSSASSSSAKNASASPSSPTATVREDDFVGKMLKSSMTLVLLSQRQTRSRLDHAFDIGVTHMDLTDKSMVIFYGSQTGTAEEYAQRFAKDARKYGVGALVADLQDYDMVRDV
jgi:sulfite reductase alpha subunit-like flavoprotein